MENRGAPAQKTSVDYNRTQLWTQAILATWFFTKPLKMLIGEKVASSRDGGGNLGISIQKIYLGHIFHLPKNQPQAEGRP